MFIYIYTYIYIYMHPICAAIVPPFRSVQIDRARVFITGGCITTLIPLTVTISITITTITTIILIYYHEQKSL